MEALADVSQLANHLPFVMDEDEQREAQGTLEYLSDDARHYGSAMWVDPASTPRQVINMVLKAAVRHLRNPDGYTVSRAGDETLGWTDRGHDSGGAEFTRNEIERLRELGGYRRSGFHSVDTFAWGRTLTGPPPGLVPDEASETLIQMFASEDEW